MTIRRFRPTSCAVAPVRGETFARIRAGSRSDGSQIRRSRLGSGKTPPKSFEPSLSNQVFQTKSFESFRDAGPFRDAAPRPGRFVYGPGYPSFRGKERRKVRPINSWLVASVGRQRIRYWGPNVGFYRLGCSGSGPLMLNGYAILMNRRSDVGMPAKSGRAIGASNGFGWVAFQERFPIGWTHAIERKKRSKSIDWSMFLSDKVYQLFWNML